MHAELPVSEALAHQMGLSADEFGRIQELLGRLPTYTELGMFAVMWSEHCSYKSSRALLRQLPTTGPRVLQGPGENAGVVDIGDGLAVVFKMESHNHPSFIEPYQGAATGVGGILRDIFTMGARPIACLNALRFGQPDDPRTRHLLSGVVAGIAGYGNAFGVPTVGGDVAFEECYGSNILVNVMAVGLCRADRIFRAAARGVGNPVLYLGQRTGRDGIHGATMASAEFGTDAEQSRPAVQVGDPFVEKLLLEACLRLMARPGLVVGIQDMGAAGLTSSSVEMAARAGSGIELWLDRVPLRAPGMTPYEIMLSESQERMLLVVERGREQEAMELCREWDLEVAVIGQVTDTGRLVVYATPPGAAAQQVVADIPVQPLAEGPRCQRPQRRPVEQDALQTLNLSAVPEADPNEALLRLLASPAVADKEWVYRQYDHQVRVSTVLGPGRADAAVLRVLPPELDEDEGAAQPAPRPRSGLALTVDGNGRLCHLDPYEGTRLVVAEAYRNLCAVGAEPLAVTDCLNLASPERPEVMWQLAECVRGLADACRELGTPVVSGNVSLYNETWLPAEAGEAPRVQAIYPTPMIGMVGLLPEVEQAVGAGFPGEGYLVALLGFDDSRCELGGSEYLKIVHGLVRGRPPRLDATRERMVGQCCVALIRRGLCASAHDVSDGGLLTALAECCITGPRPVGCAVVLQRPRGIGADPLPRIDQQLFHEGPGRFVLAVPAARQAEARLLCTEHGVPLWPLGRTGGSELVVRAAEGEHQGSYREVVRLPLRRLIEAYRRGFRSMVEETPSGA
ncbi:MAG: phosphoribosylformylglycinamidine synthase subunit PurL [Myxococcales bacterium]|nr:phosphoribosylformylglycinamidine synthase subunit PurL [Myxococcota bacterium]MDW8283936.1 phosphoribosylformylglycinamidine synthase subunit PurL [Myxococcales bacterium]